MTRRLQIGIKLAVSSVAFLSLTVAAAVGLRLLLSSPTLLDRGPASVESGAIFEHRGNLSVNELGMIGSTPLVRGRRAVFHEAQFKNAALFGSKKVALNLFPDLSLTVDMHDSSAYSVNENVFTGIIENAPDSTVRILIQNGSVDGTIDYRDSIYRISDGGAGLVIVTESKKP